MFNLHKHTRALSLIFCNSLSILCNINKVYKFNLNFYEDQRKISLIQKKMNKYPK